MKDESVAASLGSLAILGSKFEEHRLRLRGMINRRLDPALRSRIDADDVLSEAYLVAQRRWPSVQTKIGPNLYPWLYRIAFDCLIEAWRKQSRSIRDVRADLPWPQSSLLMAHGLVSPGTSPTAAVRRDELKESVRRIVDLLSDHDREILWMRHEDGLSYAEAAEILDITENAASVRYVRALKRLKNLWKAACPESEEQR